MRLLSSTFLTNVMKNQNLTKYGDFEPALWHYFMNQTDHVLTGCGCVNRIGDVARFPALTSESFMLFASSRIKSQHWVNMRGGKGTLNRRRAVLSVFDDRK